MRKVPPTKMTTYLSEEVWNTLDHFSLGAYGLKQSFE